MADEHIFYSNVRSLIIGDIRFKDGLFTTRDKMTADRVMASRSFKIGRVVKVSGPDTDDGPEKATSALQEPKQDLGVDYQVSKSAEKDLIELGVSPQIIGARLSLKPGTKITVRHIAAYKQLQTQ